MCMIIHFSHSHLCWNAKPTWFHHQHTSQPRHILLLTYFGQKLKGVLYGNVNNPNQSSNDKIQGFPGTKQTSVRTDHLRSTCTLISRPYFGPRSMPQQIIVTNVTSRAPLLFKFWFVFKASVYPNHKKKTFSHLDPVLTTRASFEISAAQFPASMWAVNTMELKET